MHYLNFLTTLCFLLEVTQEEGIKPGLELEWPESRVLVLQRYTWEPWLPCTSGSQAGGRRGGP